MKFKDYFAVEPKDIKQNCIICQNFDLQLFSKEAANGFFVKTAQSKNSNIIALKNNFLAGDTVLRLKETGCKRIFLFGSCGGCGDIESGDLVIIDKAYNLESFSNMLNFNQNTEFISASQSLIKEFYEQNIYADFIKTNSACVSSLLLEEQYVSWFKENKISAIDMESSIVFSAAKAIKAEVMCAMYVADHIENNPIGKPLSESAKKRIENSRKNLAKMILDFANA